MEIEFTEAAKGQSDPFMAMINWAEASQSKAILGGDLSSTAKATGMGSGVANLQGEVRKDLRDSDAKQIQGTLTRDLLYPILALNGKADDPRRCPRFKFDTAEQEDLDAKAKRDKTIFDMGFEPDEEYINETYGGNWKKRDKAKEPSNKEKATAAAKAKAVTDLDSVDLMTTRLEAATAPAIEQTLNDIRQLMAEMEKVGESLEALPDKLMALYDYLEPEEMAKRIQLALAAAELAGMAAIENA
jgi:phage gp29-like protein